MMEDDDDMPGGGMDTDEGYGGKMANMICLPKGFAADAKEGDEIEGVIKGKLVEKDGMLHVQVETVDDMPVTADGEENRRGIKQIGDEMSAKMSEFQQRNMDRQFGKYD